MIYIYLYEIYVYSNKNNKSYKTENSNKRTYLMLNTILPTGLVEEIIQFKTLQPHHVKCMKHAIRQFEDDYHNALTIPCQEEEDDDYDNEESQYIYIPYTTSWDHREYCWYEFYSFFGFNQKQFKSL